MASTIDGRIVVERGKITHLPFAPNFVFSCFRLVDHSMPFVIYTS